MTHFLSFLMLAAFAFFAYRRSLRYLHIFQQDDYDPKRFVTWLVHEKVYDKRASIMLGVCALVSFLWPGLASFLGAGVLVFCALGEEDPRQNGKKKLNITARAKRMLGVDLILITGLASFLLDGSPLIALLFVQALPLSLVAATYLLVPYEKRDQKKYLDEASERLTLVRPMVVGVTGSYGKTSVKHILGHILEMQEKTLFTPGSVNSLMGICRIIRENLQEGCRFFIVEMGAYGRGSIRRLCGLTPPQVGIITAIGDAHVERFKTLETVARAKFELAEAVLKQNTGSVVIHKSILREPYAHDFVMKARARFVIVGEGPDVDCEILSVQQKVSGLDVSVLWKGMPFTLSAPLYGKHHGDNMALAFACAVSMGVEANRVIASMRSVPQVAHRLVVTTQADGSTLIDDAYNSNPVGFESALDLLDMMGREKKARRVLITPGVTELGERHASVHADLGKKAAHASDVAIVVCANRIPTFSKAYKEAAPNKVIVEVDTLIEARAWLAQNGQSGDILLYENDLPDLFEKKLVL